MANKRQFNDRVNSSSSPIHSYKMGVSGAHAGGWDFYIFKARSAYEGVGRVQRDPSTCEISGQKPHFGKLFTLLCPLSSDHFQAENNFLPPLVPQISKTMTVLIALISVVRLSLERASHRSMHKLRISRSKFVSSPLDTFPST